MNLVFLHLMLYFGFLSFLVNCKATKRIHKFNKGQNTGPTIGNNKKTNTKSADGLEVDKTKESETGGKKEKESKKTDHTQEHRTVSNRGDVMHKTQAATPSVEKTKSKISVMEKNDNDKDHKEAHTKSKTKTRRTKSEDESGGRKKIYKEAKTQCPEKSNSEELNAALRSEMGATDKTKQRTHEHRTIERTQCPERSLMDEMNAALASDSANNPGSEKTEGKRKIRHAVEGGGAGVLRPANVGLIGNHDWSEVHTCKTEESER